MTKKKILIVCKSFFPENSPRSFRATELAKEAVRQGHDVTVLTEERDFDYSLFLQKHPIKLKSYGRQKWKDLAPSKWKLIGDWKRKFGRLLFLLFEYPNIEIVNLLNKALKKESGYDLMISIAVPHPIHWGIARASGKKQTIAKTWVADCGDPFMGNKLESIPPPFYFSFFEKSFCRKADFISIPTEGAKIAYYPEFHDKIKIIPQGFNFDEVKLADYTPNAKPTFGYAGGVALEGVRSPVKLIKFLLEQDYDFTFHLYATGGRELIQHFEDQYPEKIVLHNRIPREDLLNHLSSFDFLVNLDNGTTVQKPSKLIDYAITGRPVLNLLGENPNFEIVKEFLHGNYQNQMRMDSLEDFNIKNVFGNFLALHTQNEKLKEPALS